MGDGLGYVSTCTCSMSIAYCSEVCHMKDLNGSKPMLRYIDMMF